MRSRGAKRSGTASIALATYLALAASAAPHAHAEQLPAGSAQTEVLAWLRHVADGVQRLRLEILELRIEIEERRTAELERDLAATQADRQRLEQETAAHLQEAAALDGQMAESGLSPEQRNDLLSYKSALLAELSGRLKARQDDVAKLEQSAHERLQNHRQLLRQSVARRSEVAPSAAQASPQN